MVLRRNNLCKISLIKGGAFCFRRLPFLFLFGTLYVWGAGNSETTTHRTNEKINLWIEALKFFEHEEDQVSLEGFINKLTDYASLDPQIVKSIFEIRVRSKDRALLFASIRSFSEKQKCFEKKSPPCDVLKELWENNLDSILFYESSAGKIERARRELLRGECKEALNFLKDVEAKEGAYKKLLEMYAEAYECLGDEPARGAITERLKKMNLFSETSDL